MIYGVNTSKENGVNTDKKIGLVRIKYGLESGRVTSTHQTNFQFLLEQHRPSGNFIDYNGDGLLDIAVTTQYMAYEDNTQINFVRIYLNEGTKTTPAFTQEFIKLSAGDVVLGGKSIGDLRISILFSDLNADGKKDLIYATKDDGNKKDGGKTRFYYSINKGTNSEMKLGPLKPILLNGVQFKQFCPLAPMGSRACVNVVDMDNDNIKEFFINKQSGDSYKKKEYEYERYLLVNNGTNLIVEKEISIASNTISVLQDKLIFKDCEKGSIIKFYTLNGKELYSTEPVNSQNFKVDKNLFSSGVIVYSIEGKENNINGVISIR